VGKLRLHVEKSGNTGPTILLLHGYLGSTATWYRTMPLLRSQMRVVAVDLPGAGHSDRPLNAPYTMPWFAGLLPRILDALGLERPFIAGHSWGGAVLLHAAAAQPDLASGLILVSPQFRGDRAPPGLRLAEIFPHAAETFFSSTLGRAVVPALVRRAGFTPKDRRSRVRARRLLENLDAPGGWEAANKIGLSSFADAPNAQLLERVKAPTLMFWGKKDPIHPPSVGHAFLRHFGGPASLVELPASHNCHDEAAGLFASHVLDWVRRAGPARDP
jgi:pimeloyl-ACP methyl ester carboxylesterase